MRTESLLAALVALSFILVARLDAADEKIDPPRTPAQIAAGHARAGCPQVVARYAHPSNSPHDCGYYVGGGAPCHGGPRCIDEGTYGWDYVGCLFQKRVTLNWWHGAKHQGGSGAYRIDGPHVVHCK